MTCKKFIFCVCCFLLITISQAQQARWSTQKANDWYAKQGWLRGSNFQPSTAINQLEMFQSETFDTATINRELGWAEDLGFNVMRVYLHHLLWTSDKEGFKKRLNTYLDISSRHGIKTLFVFFDDCWNDTAWSGKQPAPKPGVHNSGWVRDPGTMIYSNPDTMKVLEAYVKDVMNVYKNDDRILMWDLYNEPGNNAQFEKSFPLLRTVFQWARSVSPSQPITAGIWNNDANFQKLNKFQIENADIITYHNYNYIDDHRNAIDTLRKFERPLVCTEYMARRNGSIFQVIMPMLQQQNVGAINWGFVSGKTNTIFAWDTPMPDGKEPQLWFHDIYRKEKTPFSADEVNFIKSLRKPAGLPGKSNAQKSKVISVNAQQSNTLTTKEKKEGWKLLFDGKTTKGWHTYLKDTVGSKWQVNEGALVFDPSQPNTGGGDIVTNGEYENFELRLEWKISKGGNSGIIFDIQEDPKYSATYLTGPEMQVLDNIDAADNKKQNHLAGCLYDLAGDSSVSKPRPVGEWNQVKIMQNRGHLTLWLNDTKTFVGQIGSEEWNKLVANSKFAGKAFADFAKVPKGKIALQQHPGSSEWRNIKIRML